MTISGNLGIGVEGNGGGAYLNQKKNSILHIIIVTILILAK